MSDNRSIADRVTEVINRRKAAAFALAQHWGKSNESDAKSNASWNDRTGHTRQGIHGGAEKHGDIIVIYLAHTMRTGTYLETGTGIHGPRKSAYVIRPRNRKALKFGGPNGPIFAKKINHPGMKARPIIEPTLRRNIRQIKSDFKELWSE
ncbi:hypothetical protein [Paenibacillus sp. MSJ-34]|uniref:hypothetical protein n=1 Tax=Paenibacillus sp. MSJ-34 TaxID=2841529 RepID=UPI001C0F776C|nr:hypothetical protein [Paenibacillus sp. MSJ-34]MBU5441212.1 hypothetical protein [Paenibacillus sp. MSJ-34]